MEEVQFNSGHAGMNGPGFGLKPPFRRILVLTWVRLGLTTQILHRES